MASRPAPHLKFSLSAPSPFCPSQLLRGKRKSPSVTDPWQGLSGAPLVLEVRGTWFLAGLHSFGDACQGPARPAVFTALPTYENWVSSLDWQVYFSKEPEPEPEPGSCLANMSMWPWGLLLTLPSPDPSLCKI